LQALVSGKKLTFMTLAFVQISRTITFNAPAVV